MEKLKEFVAKLNVGIKNNDKVWKSEMPNRVVDLHSRRNLVKRWLDSLSEMVSWHK